MKQEKKKMSKKMIGIIAGVSVALIALVVVWCVGMNQDFDAGKYVSTILDYTFKGKTSNTEDMFDSISMTQLENQYQTQITTFVEKSITGGVEMDAETKEKYIELCKDIFKAMKYKVKVVEKVGNDEYKVAVEYRATDVFQKYMTAAAAEEQRLKDKVNKGEYKGTREEIDLQIQTDILQSNYELLNTAYQEMKYDAGKEMVFSVEKGKNEMFALDGEELSDFIVKIIGLDEIQD